MKRAIKLVTLVTSWFYCKTDIDGTIVCAAGKVSIYHGVTLPRESAGKMSDVHHIVVKSNHDVTKGVLQIRSYENREAVANI